jgi:DNA-binding MarR family transcriptional regulator
VPRQPTSLLFDLFVAGQQARTLLTRVMAPAPLRPDQYAVYSAVLEFGPITPTELARLLGMPLTTLLEYTHPMEHQEHARRRLNARDQRSYLLELTASGKEMHRRTNVVFEVASAGLLARLQVPELEARRTLRAIADAAAAANEAVG